MMQIRKSHERGHANHGWLDSYHTFSFAGYYDPEHMGFADLRVINEDRVEGGQGFPPHPHQDMEIITYMLEGALAHRDSMGNSSVIHAGEVQRMSAGSGVRHSEYNALPDRQTHFLQIWLYPARAGITPSYEQKAFDMRTHRNRLHLLISPDGREGSLHINQDALLYGAVLEPGRGVEHEFAVGRKGYIHIARGSARIGDEPLSAGDAVALTDTAKIDIKAETAAEILLFDLT
jgi:redox-sensitive bicupin YhaK (pirin superfamily)